MGSQRLQGLDAQRGIAALCVLLFHATGASASNAYLAVDFFFMLSGYVMARTYEARLANGMPPVQFVAVRVRRLWPTMFLAGLVGLPWLASYLPADIFWPIAVANLLLIPTLTHNRVYLLNGSAWSILYELLANVLHAFAIRHMSTRAILLALVPLTALLAYSGLDHALELGATPATLPGGVLRVLVSYGIGVVLWRTWQDEPAIAVSGPFALVAMPLMFAITAWLGVRSLLIDLMFVLLVCPMLIAGGLRLTQVRPELAWLGSISFPLYAVHIPLMMTCSWLGLGAWWGAALSLPLAWVLLHLAPRLGQLPLWLGPFKRTRAGVRD